MQSPKSSRPASEPQIAIRRSRNPAIGFFGSKRCTRTQRVSPATGKSYDPPTPKHFSFNAPAGACPVCHGLGQKMVFDEHLVVPDPEKSLDEGAVLPWRRGGKRMIVYYKGLLRAVAAHYGAEPGNAFQESAGRFQDSAALHGSGETEIDFHFWRAGKVSKVTPPFEGVIPESGTALPRERKRVHAQPAQGIHEPAILRCLRGTTAEAGNSGGDGWGVRQRFQPAASCK